MALAITSNPSSVTRGAENLTLGGTDFGTNPSAITLEMGRLADDVWAPLPVNSATGTSLSFDFPLDTPLPHREAAYRFRITVGEETAQTGSDNVAINPPAGMEWQNVMQDIDEEGNIRQGIPDFEIADQVVYSAKTTPGEYDFYIDSSGYYAIDWAEDEPSDQSIDYFVISVGDYAVSDTSTLELLTQNEGEEPIIVDFTSEQFSPGLTGLINTTTDPLRIYGASRRTVWAGHITGSDAVITANSNFGANNNLVEVSIDGSPFVSADHVGADYTLFSGLPDQSRFVAIRYGAAFATAPYIVADGNVLKVTGVAPALQPFSHWAELRDGNPLTAFSAMTAAAPENYSPAYIAATSGTINGSNVACIKLRGAFNQLVAACNTTAIFISKNGAAPVRYDRPEDASGATYCFLAEDLGGDLATYHVWSAGSTTTQFSVSGDAPLVDCGTKRRLDQYGDSITHGPSGGAGRGEVDTMKVAARLGFVGSTSGVSGHTTTQCNTLLDTVLPGRVISSEDVAILAIGRNDTGSGLPQVEYESCINKLLSAGYGTVLCRGVIPGSNEVPWTDFNTNIQGVVSGLSDPRVVYIDTDDWVGLSFSDATHPDAAGYDVMTEYAVISYSDALDITPTVEPFEFTASGGITVGGTASLFHAFAATGSGGITVSGSADYSGPTAEPFNFTGSGGISVSGTASYSFPGVIPENNPLVMQVAYDSTTKLVTVQPAGAIVPPGSVIIGGFNHTEEGDPLGYVGNHVLYHHVQDLLYKEGEYNMQAVIIIQDPNPTFPEEG